jgi:hypothetical protein
VGEIFLTDATFVEDGAGNWTASGEGTVSLQAAGTRSNSCGVGILEMPLLPPGGVPIRIHVNDTCDVVSVPSQGGPTMTFTRLP